MNTNTARNFALQLGALATLYVSIIGLITLAFGVTNVLFPNQLEYYGYTNDPWQIRFGIATLIVFFPTFITLTRMVNRVRRKETEGAYLTLTKWLIYLSLLVGGAVLLGDLVTVIFTFLNGDITIRFIIKSLILVAVIGSACAYYLLDAKSYWISHEKESIRYGMFVTAVVLCAVAYGFTHVDLPESARAKIGDTTRVQHLFEIQNQIGEYYRVKQGVPETLDSLSTMNFGYIIPVDPITQIPYEYRRVATTTFELCATFEAESDATAPASYPMGAGELWKHGAGKKCFERNIDSEFYRPLSQLQKKLS